MKILAILIVMSTALSFQACEPGIVDSETPIVYQVNLNIIRNDTSILEHIAIDTLKALFTSADQPEKYRYDLNYSDTDTDRYLILNITKAPHARLTEAHFILRGNAIIGDAPARTLRVTLGQQVNNFYPTAVYLDNRELPSITRDNFTYYTIDLR